MFDLTGGQSATKRHQSTTHRQERSRLDPDEAVEYARAITLGKHGGGHGNQHTGGKPKRGSAAHWLARLDRAGHAKLAAKVRAGEITARAAAKLLGWQADTTPLARILKLVPKLSNKKHARLIARLAKVSRKKSG
jgi:hypothetical protein